MLATPDSKPAHAASFLQDLFRLRQTLAFSLVAQADSIFFQIAIDPEHRGIIQQELDIYYPGALLTEVPEEQQLATARHAQWAYPQDSSAFSKTLSDFKLDPYAALLRTLSDAKPDTYECISVYFAPVPDEVFHGYARDNTPWREAIGTLAKKLPAWMVAARLASTDPNLLKDLRSTFHSQYATPTAPWQFSRVQQIEHDDGAIPAWNMLSTAELASLVHFPDKAIQCDRLETTSMKAKLPPALYSQSGILLGHASARGVTKDIRIPDEIRDRHVYIVGKSGTGKSTLPLNAICQDIEAGAGMAVIDPHGDLVRSLLSYIPEHRIPDVIYFNAADTDYPIAFNPFSVQTSKEATLVADDLMTTFRRLADTWGPQMEHILRYTFDTLISYGDATFFDIKTILQNPQARTKFLSNVDDEDLLSFWQNEFRRLEKDTQPILNRVSKFSRDPYLRAILGRSQTGFRFREIIATKKIFLANISKGEIGADTSSVLGSLLVSQIQMAAMRQASLPEEERVPFYLFVDEFHNFMTSAFEVILSEARKYKLCLMLAHQYVSQLSDQIRKAILGNVGL